MKQHQFQVMALTAALSTGALFGAADVQAADVDDVLKAGKQNVATAKASQKRIDKIADDTVDIVIEYKSVNKQIEGQRIYNEMMERQIADQMRAMAELRDSYARVQETERQIPPMTQRMIDVLEDYIALDMPFNRDERRDRLEQLRANLGRSDLSVAERFRQVLEAYTIELEYGTKIDTYVDQIELEIGGQEQQVNILRVGRIALIYQTKDQSRTGVWDQDAREWVDLDAGEYRNAIANAIRIAKKTATIDVLTLPIKAPEAQ